MSKDQRSAFLTLLKERHFRRFFVAQFVSSLGDWIGVFALATLAAEIAGPAGIGVVMTARVIPGVLIGPMAGVFADRWQPKRIMITADLVRAALYASLPLMPTLPYLLIVSVITETLSLVWGPAKDASMPQLVRPAHLAEASSLNLLGVYGPWPLASVVFAFVAGVAAALNRHGPSVAAEITPEALALYVNAATFVVSALLVSRLPIPSSVRRDSPEDRPGFFADLLEGFQVIRTDKRIRPWLIGIGMTFVAAGAVFSLGVTFVQDVLGGGKQGFAITIGFLSTGLLIGLVGASHLARRVSRDVVFSSALFLLGTSLLAFASMNSLDSAIPAAATIGFFGGSAYSTAYALMYEGSRPEVHGRMFAAAYTVIRLGILVGLGLSPFLASAIGDHYLGNYLLSGTRATLWIAGGSVMLGGVFSARAIGVRLASVPVSAPATWIVIAGSHSALQQRISRDVASSLSMQHENVRVVSGTERNSVEQRIRRLAQEEDDLADATRTLLELAERTQIIGDTILPALERGQIVIQTYSRPLLEAKQKTPAFLQTFAGLGTAPDIVFDLHEPNEADSHLHNELIIPDELKQHGVVDIAAPTSGNGWRVRLDSKRGQTDLVYCVLTLCDSLLQKPVRQEGVFRSGIPPLGPFAH